MDGMGIGRRRFVTGVAAVGAVWSAGFSARQAAAAQPSLSVKQFDLTIGPVPVNITGTPRLATGINGTMPGPILRWRQGQTVTLNVRNTLRDSSSIHWHGIRSPADMDGVPGLSFAGIAPGDSYLYRIPLHQSGTYWYHSHSHYQEQTGLYGAIVVEPAGGYADRFDRDFVIVLSDWSDHDPETLVSNLKFQSDYYDYRQRTVGTFAEDARKKGLGSAIANRLMWGRMRMSPTDIADVSGATYTYLLNGQPPGANWTAVFRPGERVRLRFINSSSMTFFDVRIPGLTMHVVEADGNAVEPVPVDEFRIGVAETYDVIVTPESRAYTIFAQSEDRTGYARATLATGAGASAPIPSMDPRPMRTMVDMGMGGMQMGSGGMAGMDMSGKGATPGKGTMPGMDMSGGGMAGMDMSAMDQGAVPGDGGKPLHRSVQVDNVAMDPTSRLNEPGDGLDHNGRRVLVYTDLRARQPGADPRPPSREIVLHLSGNMERYIWGFDGRKFSEAEPIRLTLGERVRFTLINDTMMEHPIHLHGLWSELENGQGDYRPYKHTVIVKPGEKLSYLVSADTAGMWAYHCHLLYHMEMGMFRTVVVA